MWNTRLVAVAVAVSTMGAPLPAKAQDGAGPLVERMLAQIGGRETWAAARGFHMVEILHAGNLPLPALREYWVDFRLRRVMERTTTNTFQQLQALNQAQGWRIRDGVQSEWSPETVNGWAGFWPGIPTRVFHLLAVRDPSVEARIRPGNRLDILVDGVFAVWIATNNAGVPVAYGREEAHQQTHFLGRMESYGPVRLWATAAEPGDNWRVVMVDYELFQGEMPVSYDPPRAPGSHRPDPRP